MSNTEKPVHDGASELSGSTYYPPPPPGPPPAPAQTQTPQNPAQTSHDPTHIGASTQSQPLQQSQQLPYTPQEQQRYEKPLSNNIQSHEQHGPQYQQHQAPQPGQQSHFGHEQQHQGQPYFPPPPPPPAQHDEKQSHPSHSQQAPYSIPAYNPANPTFALPPTESAAAGGPQTQSTAQPPELSNPTYHEQPTSHQQQAGPGDEHKKSSWGGKLKSMLSAGAAAPINSLAHKLGSQSFLPETLDKECDKAASILKSFCAKGVYADPGSGQPPTSTDPKAKESSSGLIDPTKEKPKNRVIVTIPPKVISKAVGLAIFTTLRAGFQVSGATGSGILIARLPDGSWGPPSGIQVHSLGGGFQIGLDIYDCVCVINSKEALAAFTNTRVSLGSDLAVLAGPYGAGGAVDFGTSVQRGRDEMNKKTTATSADNTVPQNPPNIPVTPGGPTQEGHSSTLKPSTGDPKRRSLSSSAFKPVFSYVKSRGFYAGIQVDGTVVVERKDANGAFYGAPITVQQILQGQVPAQGPNNMWPVGARGLMETLKGAEAGVLGGQHHQTQQQQPHAAHNSGSQHPHAAMSGAIPSQDNAQAGGGLHANVGTGHTQGVGLNPLSGHAGPGQVASNTASAAPPSYTDDGSHAHVSDVKYA